MHKVRTVNYFPVERHMIPSLRKSGTFILTTLLLTLLFTLPSPLHLSAGEKADESKLRLALLPIPDVLPIYVAEENGYFRKGGIEVETLTVGSAVERDQLMQAGRIDGTINEVGGAALFNRDTVKMKIVSYARTPINSSPLFRILASPGSEITTIEQLKDVPIAVSKNTVIEYITTRMLQGGGLAPSQVKFKSVPVLPERMQLLLSGQIKAATLPDPLGFAAIQAGAIEVRNDVTVAELSASVLSFSTSALTQKKDAVRRFMAAWAQATEDLNAHPEKYNELMLKKIRVPKNVQASFSIPPYPAPAVPTEEQWQDVQTWLLEKGLLKNRVSYDSSITDAFLKR